MPVPTSWHPGEVAAQQARGFEDDVWGVLENYQEGAPDWMALFLSQLPFLSVTTLDGEGRPWTSLVTLDGTSGFIQPTTTDNLLRFTIRARRGVPIRECLARLRGRFEQDESPFEDDSGTGKSAFQLAAVGVMMHNRRRNKMEGVIVGVERADADDVDVFTFTVEAQNTFGNCPKYINTRHVLPVQTDSTNASTSSVQESQKADDDLPKAALAAVASTDLLFLSTKYSGHDPECYSADPPRLGNNHRGGAPGFLRTYWDEERSRRCIVLPDWSGNRLMMSFGNIAKDPVAGIAIPVWSDAASQDSGLLHLTCSAQVLAAEEAQQLMRGVQGAAKLWVESWTWLPHGWPVYAPSVVARRQVVHGKETAVMQDGVGWSPYNPPVRLLQRELTYLDPSMASAAPRAADLVDAHFWSETVATFTYALEDADMAKRYTPGQHIVMDCYDVLDTRIQMYTHMAQFRGGEKDLNDDGTRSWTISYATPSPSSDGRWHVEVTLRRKNRGGVTPALFRQGRMLREALDEGIALPSWRIKMTAMGIDGSSVLPPLPSGAPLRMAYVLSGIGLTPLLPHVTQLVAQSSAEARLFVVVATRRDEALITQRIIHRALSRTHAQGGSVRIAVKLILLVSSSSPADAVQADDASSAEVANDLWSSLPSSVSVDATCVQGGARLSADSFLSASATAASSDNPFRLADGISDAWLTHIDGAVVCASGPYARTAQQALVQAGVPDEKVHMESFAF